jgi:hypothetical protein
MAGRILSPDSLWSGATDDRSAPLVASWPRERFLQADLLHDISVEAANRLDKSQGPPWYGLAAEYAHSRPRFTPSPLFGPCSEGPRWMPKRGKLLSPAWPRCTAKSASAGGSPPTSDAAMASTQGAGAAANRVSPPAPCRSSGARRSATRTARPRGGVARRKPDRYTVDSAPADRPTPAGRAGARDGAAPRVPDTAAPDRPSTPTPDKAVRKRSGPPGDAAVAGLPHKPRRATTAA